MCCSCRTTRKQRKQTNQDAVQSFFLVVSSRDETRAIEPDFSLEQQKSEESSPRSMMKQDTVRDR